MTLEQFQNLKIGDIVVAKLVNSKQSRVNPVTNIDKGTIQSMKKLTKKQKARRQILFNMPYLLLTFLIKERVLDRFLDNTSKYAIVHSINLSCLYTKLRDPYAAIECTFAWDCTKEGYDFWKGLNDKYKSIWEMSDSGALLLLSDC